MTTVTAAVHRMIQDAARRYGVQVRVNQSNRTALEAQQFHVCHMFVYNYFPHRCPKFCVEGGRTIDWARLSDAGVKWELIDQVKAKFLRTKAGNPVTLKPGTMQWSAPPDEQSSRKAMAKFLRDHHVSSMAAPGVNGCGEPCCCKGHASKHITGQACDLHGLDILGTVLAKADPKKYPDPVTSVDVFLHDFGLYRPLAKLSGKSQELWHVEAIPLHVKHHGPKHHRASHYKHHSRHHDGC